ncbi:MAG: DUF4292 domain-containing protein [Flavobacteriales bacterium]|nr:DUF4292 domain-containing protein [Flavobacteriales bacterium]
MNKQLLFLIIGIFLITACNVKKMTISNTATPPKSAKALIEKVEINNKPPEWLSLKGKISLDKEGQQIKFSTDIRIRKDSAIWMSVRAPFGIEIFRAVIRADSVFYMNTLKSTFSKQPISNLHKHLKTEINFQQVQDMFFGTPSIDKAKYSFSENEKGYLISARNKEKGIISFSIEKDNFRIIEGSYFKSNDEYFKFNLTEYIVTENDFTIPKNVMLDVQTSESFLIELNYSKITVNKVQKMQFTIPKSYVETN